MIKDFLRYVHMMNEGLNGSLEVNPYLSFCCLAVKLYAWRVLSATGSNLPLFKFALFS